MNSSSPVASGRHSDEDTYNRQKQLEVLWRIYSNSPRVQVVAHLVLRTVHECGKSLSWGRVTSEWDFSTNRYTSFMLEKYEIRLHCGTATESASSYLSHLSSSPVLRYDIFSLRQSEAEKDSHQSKWSSKATSTQRLFSGFPKDPKSTRVSFSMSTSPLVHIITLF